MRIKTCKFFLQNVFIVLFSLPMFSTYAVCVDINKDLISAINRDDYEKFTLLIENGVDPNAKDERGTSALLLTLNTKKEEMAKALILKGANVNDKYALGVSALFIAINHKLNGAANLLIEYGADVSGSYQDGTNILMVASSKNMLDVIEKIVEKKVLDINSTDKRGLTALTIALNEKNLEAALLLNHLGALPTNLLEATIISDLESIKKFVDSKANLEIRDSSGNTPLILAFLNSNYEAASYLLKNKSAINAQNNNGLYPALISAMKNDSSMLSLALEYNADVLMKDINGLTPLSYAVFFDNYDMIGQILEYNKSAGNIADQNGCTPLIFAVVKPDRKIAVRLFALGVPLNTKKSRSILSSVIGVGDVEAVERLIKKGARVNFKNTRWIPPLLMAINRDNLEIVKLIISNGANLDAKDRDGNTSLDYAKKYAGKDLMRFLLKDSVLNKIERK
ncbi:MAG: ankyrin repeat domain-containing protein [Endomicrobium sp.]|nr:ankyrin repeat domain-containing protein [Endomicrobium sp.]